MRSNCLLWALSAYRAHHAAWVECGRIRGREPALRIRCSRVAPRWVLHWQVEFYDPDESALVLEQFAPDEPRAVPWWLAWTRLWYSGHVKRGDFPDTDQLKD